MQPVNKHYRAEIYHEIGGKTEYVLFYASKSTEGLESVYEFIQEQEQKLNISRVEIYFVDGREEEFVDLL